MVRRSIGLLCPVNFYWTWVLSHPILMIRRSLYYWSAFPTEYSVTQCNSPAVTIFLIWCCNWVLSGPQLMMRRWLYFLCDSATEYSVTHKGCSGGAFISNLPLQLSTQLHITDSPVETAFVIWRCNWVLRANHTWSSGIFIYQTYWWFDGPPELCKCTAMVYTLLQTCYIRYFFKIYSAEQMYCAINMLILRRSHEHTASSTFDAPVLHILHRKFSILCYRHLE
jgi:hypothetical protein